MGGLGGKNTKLNMNLFKSMMERNQKQSFTKRKNVKKTRKKKDGKKNKRRKCNANNQIKIKMKKIMMNIFKKHLILITQKWKKVKSKK